MGKIYTALGLMSGTSLDGVDVSIIESDGNKEYIPILDRYFKYDSQIVKKLLNIRSKIKIEDQVFTSLRGLCHLHGQSQTAS